MTMNFRDQLEHLLGEYDRAKEDGYHSVCSHIEFCMLIGMELLKPNSQRDYKFLNCSRIKGMLDPDKLD